MNRAEVLAAYSVNADGVIQSPGKFEGEMVYVPALWDATLEGSADTLDWSDGSTTYLVEITSDDVRDFPELAETHAVHMGETEQGFVWCELLLTERETRRLERRNEKDAENFTEE